MKNLLFNLLIFFVFYLIKNKNLKKISTSPHLPLSKLNYFEKKTHTRHSHYKQNLKLFSKKDLWVETNLNCFLNLFEEYQEKKLNILELGSYQGASAFLFLNLLKNSKITCVDSFTDPINFKLNAKT